MTFLVAVTGALGLLLLYDGLTRDHQVPKGSGLFRLDRLVAEAGLRRLSGLGLAALCAGAALVALVMVAGITSSLVIASAAALAGAWLPAAVVAGRAARRRGRLREAWPDAIAILISGVRAGMSLPESCTALAARGPEDLREGFSALTASYRATGSFRSALSRLQDVLADPVADRVAAALILAHDVGGTELVGVLRALGDFVREDLRVRREIEARWSWTRMAARVAAGAPWIVLLLMATRPEAAAAYNSPAGVVVVSAGGVATILGYRLMLRAARLPEQRRLSP